MKPPIPPHEAERLHALRGLDILDTPSEPAFDDITRLASYICEVPIAMVTLVDADRQWMKSVQGLQTREASRDVSFCAHAIVEPDTIMEVHDALHDRRFAMNPFVTEDPHIRFYAGAPLVMEGGYALGTLCVLDRVPRTLTPEQKEALAALQRRVISELGLRRLNGELNRLNAEKNRMLGMAAHDLRNPIAVISTYSDLLLKDPAGEISAQERAEILGEIATTSGQMLRIVNDFLDITKIESGNIQLNRQTADVTELVSHVVSLNRILAVKKGITLEYLPAVGRLEAQIDPSKIEQVLTNLVSNALKFSAPGASVRVALVPDADGVRIMVEDHGRGIAADQLVHLFQPFSKAHTRGTAGEPGSGLGLAIARKIVDAHGGQIAVTSVLGKGSTFSVRLPRRIGS